MTENGGDPSQDGVIFVVLRGPTFVLFVAYNSRVSLSSAAHEEGDGMMSKTFIGLATLALLALAHVCEAQPRGITPEMIATALPVEGAPLAQPGPYAVSTEPAFEAPGLMVFRPMTLDAFPKKDSLPLMVWGSGGCAIDSTRYGGFLSTIASHGFLTVTSEIF